MVVRITEGDTGCTGAVPAGYVVTTVLPVSEAKYNSTYWPAVTSSTMFQPMITAPVPEPVLF